MWIHDGEGSYLDLVGAGCRCYGRKPIEPLPTLVRVCKKCNDALRSTKKRPKLALHFPPQDPRFTCLSSLEFKLIRPVVPFVAMYRLYAGSEQQHCTYGNSINFYNDAMEVTRKLPRPVGNADAIFVRATRTDVSPQVQVRQHKLEELLNDVLRVKSSSIVCARRMLQRKS